MSKRITRAAVGALALSAATLAHAWDFEAGVGASTFDDHGNGTWYQEGFDHTLKLKSPALMVGLTGEATNWLRWHADYVYVGTVSSNALATPVDSNYNQQTHACNGSCVAMSRFVGGGNLNGVKLTLEPHFDYRGWQFGAEFGPFIYRPTWRETVYNWVPGPGVEPSTIEVKTNQSIHVGAVVGASVSYKRLSVVYNHFFATARGTQFPPIWKSADMLMLSYRF